MKTFMNLVLGLAPVMALANPSYVNTIRQIQEDSGIEWDVTVAPAGEMASREGVGPLGSNYELWTLHTETGESYLLDSEFVSAYTPSAEIEIVTGDPYTVTPRTRVDKPFSVQFEIDGLLSEPEAPESARRVDWEHLLFSYPEGQHGFEEETPVGTVLSAGQKNENHAFALNFAVSNLTGEDLTEVEGEEVFSVYSFDDGLYPAELLDQQKVIVWPIAKAEIAGIEDDSEYSNFPPLTIKLTDLYPDSTTYVRLYRGKQTDNPQNAIEINDTDLVIYDVEPQDRTLTLSSLNERITDGGIWTIEVIHETPWGAELLTHKSPVISNTIRVRAGLYSK